jgi:hypothetical protein
MWGAPGLFPSVLCELVPSGYRAGGPAWPLAPSGPRPAARWLRLSETLRKAFARVLGGDDRENCENGGRDRRKEHHLEEGHGHRVGTVGASRRSLANLALRFLRGAATIPA